VNVWGGDADGGTRGEMSNIYNARERQAGLTKNIYSDTHTQRNVPKSFRSVAGGKPWRMPAERTLHEPCR
jgi:hypothetical protein